MSRHAPRLVPSFLLAALGLATQGCFTYRAIGVSELDVAPRQKIPLVCITHNSGRTAEMIEGDVAGKPAVSVSGAVIGFSPTLPEAQEVEGMQVYVGQKCLMSSAPLCDHGMAVKKDDRRYFLYWMKQYESPALLPASTQMLVAERQGLKLFSLLQGIDLDGPTHAAYVSLSEKRSAGATVRMTTLLAGATAQTVGKAEHNKDLTKAGGATIQAGQQISAMIAETEKPLIDAHPKLLPVLQTITALGFNPVFCAGRVPGASAAAR
jgi:hypothetical protein